MEKKKVLNPKLLWMDLEMTGLDLEKCTIVEVVSVVTDSDLKIIEEGPDIVVHQTDDVLAQAENQAIQMHKESGLWEEIQSARATLKEAEGQTLEFVKKHFPKDEAVLCGNSIWWDRRFIIKYMPDLDDYLHYKLIDVTTVKECVRRWYPDLTWYERQDTHRSLDDIRESIKELKYYRDVIFKLPDQVVTS